jgi:hypothetical protein
VQVRRFPGESWLVRRLLLDHLSGKAVEPTGTQRLRAGERLGLRPCDCFKQAERLKVNVALMGCYQQGLSTSRRLGRTRRPACARGTSTFGEILGRRVPEVW